MTAAMPFMRLSHSIVAALALVLAGCDSMPKFPSGNSANAASASNSTPQGDGSGSTAAGSDNAASSEVVRPPKTANEKRLEESTSRFHEVALGQTFELLAVGSVQALALCFQRYPKSPKPRQQCLANAVLAVGVVSAKGGYELAVRDEQERKKVRALQIVAEDLKRDNDQLQAVVDATTAQVAESKARLEVLKKDIAGKKVATAQVQAARKREEDNLASMRKSLEDAKLAQSTYKATAANREMTGTAAEKKQVDADIKAMDAKVVALERNIKSLQDALVVSAV